MSLQISTRRLHRDIKRALSFSQLTTNMNECATADAAAVTISTCIETECLNYRMKWAEIMRSVLIIFVIQKSWQSAMAEHVNGTSPVSARVLLWAKEKSIWQLVKVFKIGVSFHSGRCVSALFIHCISCCHRQATIWLFVCTHGRVKFPVKTGHH